MQSTMQLTEVEMVAWEPSGGTQLFTVKANQSVLIGKSKNCGVQLSGHGISEIHCRIGFEGGELWVQDWMSNTGTKVNGDPVTTKTHFGQGCIVEIGNYRIQLSKADAARLKSKRDDQGESQAPMQAVPQAVLQAAPPVEAKTAPPPLVRKTDSQPKTRTTDSPSAGKTDSAPKALPLLRPQTQTSSTGSADVKNESASKAKELAKERDPVAKDRNQTDVRQPSMKMASNFEPLSHDDETYDRETVELLLAEIEDLRQALAQGDFSQSSSSDKPQYSADTDDQVVRRIQELSEEANRADERVLILEEMLQAAEDANRSEVEERAHLEAWVGDIEKRIGQREAEHAAELDALRARLESAENKNNGLQRQLQQSVSKDDNAQRYADMMEKLQLENRQLQDTLEEVRKELRQLQQKYENQSTQSEAVLRGDLAKIAKEHAEMSRLKFEYAKKIRELEELPRPSSQADPSLQGLREHRQILREMSQEKKEQSSLSLAGRLKRLWNRVENS